MTKLRSIDTLVIDSSVLCCNFVNTVSSWTEPERHDYLTNFKDFTDWCSKLDVFSADRLKKLEEYAVSQPQEAVAALDRIREIRELLHGLISSVARESSNERSRYLPAFNMLLVDAASRQRLLYSEKNFQLEQVEIPGDLMAPVWKAVLSLADLLTKHDAKRIKECPKCGWVFLDETRNGSRIWCNPLACGTTDKMMRYNQRKKKGIAT